MPGGRIIRIYEYREVSILDPAILQNSYNLSAQKYDDTFRKIQYEKFSTLVDPGSVPADAHILDHGCGTALLYEYLRQERLLCNYYGIDFAHGMVTCAARKTATVLVGNIASLPFHDSVFDLVYSFTVIGLSDEPPADIFNEIRRVLKQDGRAVVSFLARCFTETAAAVIEKSGLVTEKQDIVCGQDIGMVLRPV